MRYKLPSTTFTVAVMAAALGLAVGAPAEARLVYTDVDSSNPGAAESDFLNKLTSEDAHEDFQGFAPKDVGPFPNTAVGSFKGKGAPDKNSKCLGPCQNLRVFDSNSSPFDSGRQPVEGSQWLDSHDLPEIVWDFGGNATADTNAFGFFLGDAADVGATLEVNFKGSTPETIATISDEPNGEQYFIGAISTKPITGARLVVENTAGNVDNDGFNIDDVTLGTAKVPAPGVLGLMGLGLLGLAGASRRRISR